MKVDTTHISTPLLGAERSALEVVAQREGRSLGQQIRIFTIMKLREAGALPFDGVLSPIPRTRKAR